ncbi:asparagine synthetase domain-containing protein 1 [Dermatophagoides pteronyssinus]|uniref:Asparagine synthetase domain-containing protein 1-like n=1 Tax=Dermatophagoides pteronyssinus TaxID=6956 RepID=A0A6P6XPG0_DERPT|nr:asparagine synthetase domain-containing protein 1-like [Dermatophagoides pteronyssinus]
MCGILFVIIDGSDLDSNIFNRSKIKEFLRRRGPDQYQSFDFIYNTFQFHLESSVLHLRGQNNSGRQPYCGHDNYNADFPCLQWNGQIFRLIDDNNQYKAIDDSRSDTEELFRLLTKSGENVEDIVLKTLSSIHGPFSLTFWNQTTEQLWVARDLIGRRSLCWNTNMRDKFLIISSVAHPFENDEDLSQNHSIWDSLKFEEIPSDRVFCFDMSENKSLEQIWQDLRQFYWPKTLAGFHIDIDGHYISRMPIISMLNMEIPSSEIDDLLKISNIFNNEGFVIDMKICDNFLRVLSESIQTRCKNHQNRCKECINFDESDCKHSTIAILFSGGLDSAVLARIADQFVEPKHRPIDLLNVAFDSKASDRKTGIDAWNELCHQCPKRQWNFVQIDIDRNELELYRNKHIHNLIDPNWTIMDDSIGSAIWFATRGQGILLSNHNSSEQVEYKSPARVVLLGMGSDEQLGGYSRHRQAFQKGNWTSLLNEIRIDIERISSRNLGRDDRITADHSIEARFPYLDELVINFLNPLPIWQKCNLYLERGHGEKWLLRKVAQNLGLQRSCQNLKRAIQFGSKITSHQNGGVKGHYSYQK